MLQYIPISTASYFIWFGFPIVYPFSSRHETDRGILEWTKEQIGTWFQLPRTASWWPEQLHLMSSQGTGIKAKQMTTSTSVTASYHTISISTYFSLSYWLKSEGFFTCHCPELPNKCGNNGCPFSLMTKA